jgi:hypothetical protein
MFAKRLPLELYRQAASSPSLPRSMQRDLALAGWTRSILLNDFQEAKQLAPLVAKWNPRSGPTGTPFRQRLLMMKGSLRA